MPHGRLIAPALLLLVLLGGCAKSMPTPSPLPAPLPPTPVRPALPTPPPSPPPPPPVVSPQLGQPEEERLRREAMTRIDSAERLVKQLADRRLGAEQQETLSTIQSFITKARDALGTQNLQQAFTLADKADALARDLIRTTR